jgi:GTP1/Obg family GTP-binding protein
MSRNTTSHFITLKTHTFHRKARDYKEIRTPRFYHSRLNNRKELRSVLQVSRMRHNMAVGELCSLQGAPQFYSDFANMLLRSTGLC